MNEQDKAECSSALAVVDHHARLLVKTSLALPCRTQKTLLVTRGGSFSDTKRLFDSQPAPTPYNGRPGGARCYCVVGISVASRRASAGRPPPTRVLNRRRDMGQRPR